MIPHWYADACAERAATAHDAALAALREHAQELSAAADPGRSCGCALTRSRRHQDPAAEILAVLCEPLGLPGDQLPSYDVVPPGACSSCHRGPAWHTGTSPALCLYCRELHHLQAEARPPGTAPGPFYARDWKDRYPVAYGALWLLGCCAVLVIILAVHGALP